MNDPARATNQDEWWGYEEILLQFESAWRIERSPDLNKFLPTSEDEGRSYLLAELIKIDMDYRWRSGDEVTVEHYGTRFPELRRDGLWPVGLIREELRVRKAANKLPTRDVFSRRFPEQCDEFMSLLDDSLRPAGKTSPTSSKSTILGTPDESTIARAPSPVVRKVGRYEIVGRVGRGSFAQVYQARDPRLDRDVAIKMPRAGVVDFPELRERFFREARAVAALNHPGIVPIFEVGEVDEQPYIVAEFVEGGSLDELLREKEPSLSQFINWLIEVSQSVHYAHQCGVVHRDIKPANIMVSKTGALRLTDFGLAQQDDGATLTREGDIIGTPAYMSPEQARGDGQSVDARSDVYSLGVLMYRLVTGQLPFQGTSASVLSRVINDQPTPPRSLRRETPRDLETVCLKCLSKEPKERYQSADEFAQDLRRFQNGEPILARRATFGEHAWKWSRRHPALATTVAIATVLAFLLLGLSWHLQTVRLDRDLAVTAEIRAKQAEQDRKVELSRSNAQAGILALQRGQAREAIGFLSRSIELGHSDPIDLTLRKIEAHVVLHDLTAAEAMVASLAENPELGEHAGRCLVWQADFAMRQTTSAEPSDTQSPDTLFKIALTHTLSESDQHYVRGMLAETTGDALKSFRQAIRVDPFHHRARTMTLNLLVTSGQLDGARFELATSRQLFPEDPYLDLIDGLLLTLDGDSPTADALLQKLNVSDEQRDAWDSFYGLVSTLSKLLQDPSVIEQQFAPVLREQIAENALAIGVVVDSGLRLPLILRNELAEIGKNLADDDAATLKRALANVVAIHPEGSMMYALGELHLADREFGLGRDAFLQARITPSLARQHQMRCELGIIGTTVMLGLVKQQDMQHNTELAAESIRRLDPGLPFPSRRCKLFAQIGIRVHDVDLSRQWMEKWKAHSDADRSDVLYHQMELELLDHRYDAALAVCEELLQIDPTNEHVAKQRDSALGFLREALSRSTASADGATDQ